MTADDVVRIARECIDTPFLHQGRVSGLGLDCAGLLVHVVTQLGLPHEDVRGYSRTPHAHMLEQLMDRQESVAPVPLSELQAGDFLLMRFTSEPQHFAVCAGDTIIHSYMHARKCCEHDFSDEWRSRVVRAYRIKGLA